MPYQRKTTDEFQIHQLTTQGWEEVHCEPTRKDALRSRKEYQQNQPEYPVRIVKKRVKV